MKFDALLKTRSLKSDYRWVYCPDYVDQVLEEKMSFLVQMFQKNAMKNFLEQEGLQNLYYIYDENGSILIRGGFSEYTDIYGRTIYAVEGLACPAEQNRLFWYALPYLVDRLLSTSLLRDAWLGNYSELGETSSRKINFSSLTEDCLFMDKDEAGSMWQQMKDHSACMERMMRDIQDAPQMFDFVYGTRNRRFYPATAGRYYTPEELEDLPIIKPKSVLTTLYPIVNEEDNHYIIQIQIEDRNRRFAASLIARDRKGDAIAETEAMTFGKDGIDLAQLERAKKAMMGHLDGAGYCRRRKPKNEN
jgi:hypothetical protein